MMLFIFIEGPQCKRPEAAAKFAARAARAPVCAGGVLVPTSPQTEPEPGGKEPKRPCRTLCSHQPG